MNSEKVKLFEALCKAQAEMPVVGKNNENTHFKYRYADIADIIKACTPILSKHGLAIIHTLNFDGEINYLETYLTHSSGQSLCSRVKIVPSKNDLQSFGGAITYLRRYSYAAIIGLAISDDDDDGQVAMPVAAPAYKSSEYISQDQIDQLDDELSGHPEIKDNMLLSLKIKSLNQIPKEQFMRVLNRIRQIKQTKEMK